MVCLVNTYISTEVPSGHTSLPYMDGMTRPSLVAVATSYAVQVCSVVSQLLFGEGMRRDKQPGEERDKRKGWRDSGVGKALFL